MTVNDLAVLMGLIENLAKDGNIPPAQMEEWGRIYKSASNLVLQAVKQQKTAKMMEETGKAQDDGDFDELEDADFEDLSPPKTS